MPLSVQDRALENTASELYTALLNVGSLISGAQAAAHQDAVVIQNLLGEVVASIAKIYDLLKGPSTGAFNPPPNLLVTKFIEVPMSVLQLEVGQTAVGKLTFDEITPPTDGAVASDNPAVTITLDPTDHITWTAVAVSVTAPNVPANCSYTGTSVAPDVGPAVVPVMMVTVVPVPTAEHGDFDPTHAVITGP